MGASVRLSKVQGKALGTWLLSPVFPRISERFLDQAIPMHRVRDGPRFQAPGLLAAPPIEHRGYLPGSAYAPEAASLASRDSSPAGRSLAFGLPEAHPPPPRVEGSWRRPRGIARGGTGVGPSLRVRRPPIMASGIKTPPRTVVVYAAAGGYKLLGPELGQGENDDHQN